MSESHPASSDSSNRDADLHRTLIEDLRRGGYGRDLRGDFRDLYRFYMDEEHRERLAAMSRWKRGIFLTLWLLKALIQRLSPARRLMSLVAFLLFSAGNWTMGIMGFGFYPDMQILGFALLVIVLMLELKDKLLARDELEVGRAVQLALMPEGPPEVPGWEIWLFTRPANDVGGDLVDSLPLGDGRVALMLGDVSGKGLGAALVMAKLQATLRALAAERESLPELGRAVNRILCRDGIPGRFATLLYFEIEADSGTLRMVNAGHIPPTVFRESDTESPPPVSLPLGFRPEAEYREQVLEVPPGGLVLGYSDGLTEAMDPRGLFFGDVGLPRMLEGLEEKGAREAGHMLVSAVERFAGEERPSDDLSLILLKRQ